MDVLTNDIVFNLFAYQFLIKQRKYYEMILIVNRKLGTKQNCTQLNWSTISCFTRISVISCILIYIGYKISIQSREIVNKFKIIYIFRQLTFATILIEEKTPLLQSIKKL